MKSVVAAVAVVAFLIMSIIGEREARSSPKWPPPARHEVGSWQIGDPTVLTFATALNLPASVPIFFMWAHNGAFAYALDDHQPFVYLPWAALVFSLWYFVGWHVVHLIGARRWSSSSGRFVVFAVQIFITVELIYTVILDRKQTTSAVAAVSVGLWLLAAACGWINLIVKRTDGVQEIRSTLT